MSTCFEALSLYITIRRNINMINGPKIKGSKDPKPSFFVCKLVLKKLSINAR